MHDFTTRHNNEFEDLGTESNKICNSHIKIRNSTIVFPKNNKIQDFAEGGGTMTEATMRTTSLSNVSHAGRPEDEDRNDGHHV